MSSDPGWLNVEDSTSPAIFQSKRRKGGSGLRGIHAIKSSNRCVVIKEHKKLDRVYPPARYTSLYANFVMAFYAPWLGTGKDPVVRGRVFPALEN
jgi:hypothetical protein